MSQVQESLAAIAEGEDLSRESMTAAMREVMSGEATPAQIGALLMGLRLKGETVTEIAAAAAVMREFASAVEVTRDPLIDTCGTGGDCSGIFNVSTASAFVAATAGAFVAKHGNRSVSSRSGSADVLEQAGVNIDLTPEQVAHCVEDLHIGFLFAPAHHGAMKHAVGPRKELALRTLFNLLGPLTNPAGATRQVIGVYEAARVPVVAQVLHELGSVEVMVVHSDDGLDEISASALTRVAHLKNGEVSEYCIDPREHGIAPNELDTIKVSNARESLHLIREALNGAPGPGADIVALNSAAALVVSGLSDSFADGLKQSRDIMESGAAWTKLEDLARETRAF